MTKRATATFQIKEWDEKPYNESDGGPKLTRASVTRAFAGEIEGESKTEYLMVYRPDGSANFVGVERVVGRLAGRSGSFVLQHVGIYEEGLAKEEIFVVPGSATGELNGLTGKARLEIGHAQSYPFHLDYDLE